MTTKEERWAYTEYKLLQIQPCVGFVAVYADGDGDDIHLQSYPIQALAVAEATVNYAEGIRGKGIFRYYRQPDKENVIVGLELREGYWEISQDCQNFAGLCLEGEDISEAIGCLNVEYIKRLKKATKHTKE